MRKTFIALVVFVLVCVAYSVWPLIELSRLVRAIEARDAATVSRSVHFERVRASLANQVLNAYAQRSGLRVSPATKGLVAAALGIASPIIDKLITPQGVADLLAIGWPVNVTSEPPPPGTAGISRATAGSAFQIFSLSDYGLGRFEVSLPAALPRAQRFRLEFRLLQWRWMLVGITLPEGVRNLLADELIKATKTPPKSP